MAEDSACRAAQRYGYWNGNLRPDGSKFIMHIINYRGGKPGEFVLFFAWPEDSTEV